MLSHPPHAFNWCPDKNADGTVGRLLVSALLPPVMIDMTSYTHETVAKLPHAPAGAVGGFLVSVIGVLLPPVMFWGEYEMNTLANFDNPLPHIWPKGGILSLNLTLEGCFRMVGLSWLTSKSVAELPLLVHPLDSLAKLDDQIAHSMMLYVHGSPVAAACSSSSSSML